MNMIANILAAADGNSWQAHHTENIISTVLISMLIFISIKLSKHKFWGPKIRLAFKPKTAKLGLSLVLFFFFIAPDLPCF